MTRFFVPGTPRGTQTERAYADMRQHAELVSGRAARSRRIFKLSCRSAGADVEPCVGEEAVHAIFDIGDAYAILRHGGHEVVPKRHTYAAVEFD